MTSLNKIKEPLIKQQRSTYDNTQKADSDISIITKDFEKQSQFYFIYRYNSVVEVYNRNHPQKKLPFLDDTKTFYYISMLLNYPIYQALLFLFLIFGLGLNLILMGMIWFYFFFVRKQTKKYLANKKRVQNPLQDFMYLPDICQTLQKHSTTLNIDNKDLQGFTFNNTINQQLKKRFLNDNTKRLTITVYDQYFFDSYNNFTKEKNRVKVWIIISSLCIIGSIFFYLYVFGLLKF